MGFIVKLFGGWAFKLVTSAAVFAGLAWGWHRETERRVKAENEAVDLRLKVAAILAMNDRWAASARAQNAAFTELERKNREQVARLAEAQRVGARLLADAEGRAAALLNATVPPECCDALGWAASQAPRLAKEWNP